MTRVPPSSLSRSSYGLRKSVNARPNALQFQGRENQGQPPAPPDDAIPIESIQAMLTRMRTDPQIQQYRRHAPDQYLESCRQLAHQGANGSTSNSDESDANPGLFRQLQLAARSYLDREAIRRLQNRSLCGNPSPQSQKEMLKEQFHQRLNAMQAEYSDRWQALSLSELAEELENEPTVKQLEHTSLTDYVAALNTFMNNTHRVLQLMRQQPELDSAGIITQHSLRQALRFDVQATLEQQTEEDEEKSPVHYTLDRLLLTARELGVERLVSASPDQEPEALNPYFQSVNVRQAQLKTSLEKQFQRLCDENAEPLFEQLPRYLQRFLNNPDLLRDANQTDAFLDKQSRIVTAMINEMEGNPDLTALLNHSQIQAKEVLKLAHRHSTELAQSTDDMEALVKDSIRRSLALMGRTGQNTPSSRPDSPTP